MKRITKLLVIAIAMLFYGNVKAQNARMQVIHNCADLAAATVDVYVNGTILLNDFAFRTATPFVTVPAGVSLSIDVAPGNSTSSAQSIYNLTTTLAADETYVIVADGIVSASGYAPSQPFQLSVFAQGREASANAGNTDILVHHGATDAPTVDVVETSLPAGTVVNDISYPSFTSSYFELPTADYSLNVTDVSGATVGASYAAPLQTLGLQGEALTVLASGFLDPSQNSNGPAFGLWVALAGGGNLIPLPTVPLATSQFGQDQVGVYPNPVSGILTIDLPQDYRTASATVIDSNGRTLLQIDQIVSNRISFEGLAEGIYLLNLKVNETEVTKKIAVSR